MVHKYKFNEKCYAVTFTFSLLQLAYSLIQKQKNPRNSFRGTNCFRREIRDPVFNVYGTRISIDLGKKYSGQKISLRYSQGSSDSHCRRYLDNVARTSRVQRLKTFLTLYDLGERIGSI